jgi:molybdate transport system permease protein
MLRELLVLDSGKVTASDPKHQFFERPQTVAAVRLTGCKNIAPARRVAADLIAVNAWNCELRTASDVRYALTHAGIRSHQIAFNADADGENTFPCWLVATSEAPHEMTLYLRLHVTPSAGDLPHLRADVPKDLWRSLSANPQLRPMWLDLARLLQLEG